MTGLLYQWTDLAPQASRLVKRETPSPVSNLDLTAPATRTSNQIVYHRRPPQSTPDIGSRSARMLTATKMLARTIARLPATSARRGFHTTRPQLGSPYHYPEGPRSNIPFNPLTRFFAVRYWSFMGRFKSREGQRLNEAGLTGILSCGIRRTVRYRW